VEGLSVDCDYAYVARYIREHGESAVSMKTCSRSRISYPSLCSSPYSSHSLKQYAKVSIVKFQTSSSCSSLVTQVKLLSNQDPQLVPQRLRLGNVLLVLLVILRLLLCHHHISLVGEREEGRGEDALRPSKIRTAVE
jgi:hypothetical protein